jgi:hypothetical protein
MKFFDFLPIIFLEERNWGKLRPFISEQLVKRLTLK